MGLVFLAAPLGSYESCAQISFYDRQNSHFMTDKFHFMTEPTVGVNRRVASPPGLLNERSFSYHWALLMAQCLETEGMGGG